MTEFFVDGHTGVLEYQLLSCGVAQNLTGATVSLVAAGVGDVALTMTGTVVVTSATGGIVEFRPSTGGGDLTQARGPIRVRFKVVDGNSRVTYFPSEDPETWIVKRF